MYWLGWLWFLLPIIALVILSFVVDTQGTRDRRRAAEALATGWQMFETIADDLAPDSVERRDDQTMDLSVAGIKVRLNIYSGREGHSVCVYVESCPRSLVLVPSGELPPNKVPIQEPGWQTGDSAFDGALTLLGDPGDVAMTVTPQVREAATKAVGEMGWKLQGGRLCLDTPLAALAPGDLLKKMRPAVEMVKAMQYGEEAIPRLRHRLTEETAAPMLGLVVEVLFTSHLEGKKAARMARELTDHPSGRVRLYAALALSPFAYMRVFADYQDGDERTHVFRRALQLAPDLVPDEVLAAAALEALELDDDSLRVLACDLLAKDGELGVVGALHKLAATRHLSRQVRHAATKAADTILGRLQGDAAAGGLELAVNKPDEGGLELVDGSEGGLELAEDGEKGG